MLITLLALAIAAPSPFVAEGRVEDVVLSGRPAAILRTRDGRRLSLSARAPLTDRELVRLTGLEVRVYGRRPEAPGLAHEVHRFELLPTGGRVPRLGRVVRWVASDGPHVLFAGDDGAAIALSRGFEKLVGTRIWVMLDPGGIRVSRFGVLGK